MTAPDAKTQFRLITGNWNIANIIAAGGDVTLCVAVEHWLNVVAGGLQESDVVPGHHKFTLRELEVAVYQIVRLNAAVQEKTIGTTAASLAASADLLQDCLNEGMSWTVLGSVGAALALWVSYGRRCSQLRPALWVWGLGQTMNLPRHTGVALPGDIAYFEHMTFAMLSTVAGVPRGAAALRATVPCGYTSIGKRSAMFGEPLEEIGESVEIMRPGFKKMLPNVRKAKIFCVHVMRNMPPEVPHNCWFTWGRHGAWKRPPGTG